MSVPNEEAQTTLSCFNYFCENLQFTLEEEDLEQSVPFLDTKVTRHEDTIRLKWYRKKTHSDMMIHYRSNHSINMKVNVIKQMKERVSKICHESYVGEGLRNLEKIFKENGYPSGMLNKLLYASQNTEHQLRTIEDQIQTDENQLRTDGNQPRTDQNQLQESEEDRQRLHYASYPNINGLTSK